MSSSHVIISDDDMYRDVMLSVAMLQFCRRTTRRQWIRSS